MFTGVWITCVIHLKHHTLLHVYHTCMIHMSCRTFGSGFLYFIHDYNLCCIDSPCYNVACYNYNSIWPYYIIQSISTYWLVPKFFDDVTASWSHPDMTLHFFGKCTLTLALWTLIIIYYIQETYMLKNNFKSSSTTQNWRKLQHTAILSCWRHFCMLRLSKNCFLNYSTHKLLMIPHIKFEMFDDSAHEFCRMIMQVQH